MKPDAFAVVLCVLSAGLNARDYEPFVPQSTPAKPAAGAPANPADSVSTGAYRPGAGTIILAQLSKALDVKKLSVGAQVECSVIQDLLYKGKIIIPRDAKVIGHVTEAIVATKEQPLPPRTHL